MKQTIYTFFLIILKMTTGKVSIDYIIIINILYKIFKHINVMIHLIYKWIIRET